MKVAYKRASAFAEFAEALGVDTVDVLAALAKPDGVYVIWSTGPDTYFECVLTRDRDGILRRGEPTALPEFTDDIFGRPRP